MTIALNGYLFDLDGTLIDTAADIAASVNTALATVTRLTVTAAQVRTWVGRGAHFLIEQALERVGADAGALEAVTAAYASHYARHPLVESSLYEGVIETLEALRARKAPMAIVTNKPARVTRPLLHAAKLSGYFDLALCGDEVAHGKPAPDLLVHACAALSLEPAHALMVGDSSSDVAAARAAGCPVVCVSYGYNYGKDIRDCAPDRVIDSLAELL